MIHGYIIMAYYTDIKPQQPLRIIGSDRQPKWLTICQCIGEIMLSNHNQCVYHQVLRYHPHVSMTTSKRTTKTVGKRCLHHETWQNMLWWSVRSCHSETRMGTQKDDWFYEEERLNPSTQYYIITHIELKPKSVAKCSKHIRWVARVNIFATDKRVVNLDANNAAASGDEAWLWYRETNLAPLREDSTLAGPGCGLGVALVAVGCGHLLSIGFLGG